MVRRRCAIRRQVDAGHAVHAVPPNGTIGPSRAGCRAESATDRPRAQTVPPAVPTGGARPAAVETSAPPPRRAPCHAMSTRAHPASRIRLAPPATTRRHGPAHCPHTRRTRRCPHLRRPVREMRRHDPARRRGRRVAGRARAGRASRPRGRPSCTSPSTASTCARRAPRRRASTPRRRRVRSLRDRSTNTCAETLGEHAARDRWRHRRAARPAQRRPRRSTTSAACSAAASQSARCAPDLVDTERRRAARNSTSSCTRHAERGLAQRGAALARSASGRRTTNAPLALDLHYLLTAYARTDAAAEILLGYAMHLLHETPVLDAAALRRCWTRCRCRPRSPRSPTPACATRSRRCASYRCRCRSTRYPSCGRRCRASTGRPRPTARRWC